ncbi:MAG: hypothetical protein WC449_05640 [Candidatus Paceibacterota bacterium]
MPVTQPISVEKVRPTYAYRAADIAPAATPTDVLTVSGADGKVVRITKIGITGDATAAAIVDLYITKRTTANTGGTSTNPTPTKYDSADPTPSATVTLYSANPSAVGTGVSLEGDMIYLPAAATPAGEPSHWEREYWLGEAKGPVLRGASELISINFSGATLPAGAKFYFYIEWTEEAL